MPPSIQMAHHHQAADPAGQQHQHQQQPQYITGPQVPQFQLNPPTQQMQPQYPQHPQFQPPQATQHQQPQQPEQQAFTQIQQFHQPYQHHQQHQPPQPYQQHQQLQPPQQPQQQQFQQPQQPQQQQFQQLQPPDIVGDPHHPQPHAQPFGQPYAAPHQQVQQEQQAAYPQQNMLALPFQMQEAPQDTVDHYLQVHRQRQHSAVVTVPMQLYPSDVDTWPPHNTIDGEILYRRVVHRGQWKLLAYRLWPRRPANWDINEIYQEFGFGPPFAGLRGEWPNLQLGVDQRDLISRNGFAQLNMDLPQVNYKFVVHLQLSRMAHFSLEVKELWSMRYSVSMGELRMQDWYDACTDYGENMQGPPICQMRSRNGDFYKHCAACNRDCTPDHCRTTTHQNKLAMYPDDMQGWGNWQRAVTRGDIVFQTVPLYHDRNHTEHCVLWLKLGR